MSVENLGRLTAAAVRLRQLAARAHATGTAIEQRWTRGLPDAGWGPLSLVPCHDITINRSEATCNRAGDPAAAASTAAMLSSACLGCQMFLDLAGWIRELEAERDAVGKTIESLRHVAENITGQLSNGAVPGSP